MPKIEYRAGDADWMQVLVNDEVVAENHSLGVWDFVQVMEALGFEVLLPEGDFNDEGDWEYKQP